MPGQVALMRVVTRDYFATIGARLREGRFFDMSDRRSESPVAIVTVVSLILLAVATLAWFVPARRASRVDPMIALRNE